MEKLASKLSQPCLDAGLLKRVPFSSNNPHSLNIQAAVSLPDLLRTRSLTDLILGIFVVHFEASLW